MSSSILPMFYSKSFIVSGLTFRSLIHFEFIFVWGVRKCYNFQAISSAISGYHSFTCSCPVFPAPLIEEAVFALLYILASFVENKVPIGRWVYLWAFYLVPLLYISVFVPAQNFSVWALISLSDFSLLVYRNASDLHIDFVSCDFTKFTD